VEDDERVARASGTRGTPNSFINGRHLSGAQPQQKFASLIDEEKKGAQGALASGVVRADLHAHRAQQNFSKAPSKPSTAAPPSPAAMPSTTVYKVPVGQSPVQGSAQALVTLVMFQDFQCPFCKRSVQTVEQLQQEFGNDLRVVFKHNPLPFHKHAMPAAQLAMEAGVQKGGQGFWQAYDALFAETRIDDAVIEQVAKSLRLNIYAVRSAISTNRHRAAIDDDVRLAKQLGASGTPTFFINGRKLVGARAIGDFRKLIREVRTDAQVLIKRGVPRARVYAETIKNGATGPNNP